MSINPDPSKIDEYPDEWDLIPLRHWASKKEQDDGTVMQTGKMPLHPKWTERQYSRTEVRKLVERGHNFGVRLKDDQIVVDVDYKNMPPGRDTWAEMQEDLGIDPTDYQCVRTGSGGWHIYMLKDPRTKKRNEHEDYKGIEFKSAGNQVVAAGSIHPKTEKPYELVGPKDFLFDEVLQAPENLVALFGRKVADRPTPENVILDAEAMEEILNHLEPGWFPDNDTWLPLMMSLHDATGGDQLCGEVFDQWCSRGPGYKGDVLNRWDSLDLRKGSRMGVGTLRHILKTQLADKPGAIQARIVLDRCAIDATAERINAAQGDFEDDLEPEWDYNKSGNAMDTLHNCMNAIKILEVRPRYNTFKDVITFTKPVWDPDFGLDMTDMILRLLRMRMHDQFRAMSYRPSEKTVYEAVMTVAGKHKFNPVLDYLDDLEWDGKPRIDNLFGDYFSCGDGEYERAVSKAFMLGAVARARYPGCKRDEMPIIRGYQGAGKSTGFSYLFGEYFSDQDLGDLRNKDAPLQLVGVWGQEIGEMDTMSRSDVNSMKAFMSRQVDRFRKPFGKVPEEFPRRCVMMGTCNEGAFLRDTTGNRRYWVLQCGGEIDLKGLGRDRDQLWAEASARLAAGEHWGLDKGVWTEAARRADEEMAVDPWAEEVAQIVLDDWAMEGEERYDRISSRDLLERLVRDPNQRTPDKAKRLRNVVEGVLKWPYKKAIRIGGRSVTGYLIPDDWPPAADWDD